MAISLVALGHPHVERPWPAHCLQLARRRLIGRRRSEDSLMGVALRPAPTNVIMG